MGDKTVEVEAQVWRGFCGCSLCICQWGKGLGGEALSHGQLEDGPEARGCKDGSRVANKAVGVRAGTPMGTWSAGSSVPELNSVASAI
jgi:hypothetical protein